MTNQWLQFQAPNTREHVTTSILIVILTSVEASWSAAVSPFLSIFLENVGRRLALRVSGPFLLS